MGIANILSGPLVSLEPTLRELMNPGGTLVLSGLLEHELPLILATYQQYFDVVDVATQEQWVRVTSVLR